MQPLCFLKNVTYSEGKKLLRFYLDFIIMCVYVFKVILLSVIGYQQLIPGIIQGRIIEICILLNILRCFSCSCYMRTFMDGILGRMIPYKTQGSVAICVK